MRRSISLALIVMVMATALIAVTPLSADGYDPSVCANDITGKPLSPRCAEMIEAFPSPVGLTQIEQDKRSLDTYSFWKVGPNAIPLFDSPGGNAVGEIGSGFNFVRATDLSVEGWIRIIGGKWIRASDAKFSPPSFFRGVELQEGLTHPFAWVLDLSRIYTSEFPGGEASKATGRWLRRYELVNIFATAKDAEGWRWYMIGQNQWVKQTFVAKALPVKRPAGVTGRWVAVDLYEQTLVAYENDTPVFATVIASGLPPNETREGTFKVWAKLEQDTMSGATGAPDAYALQSVPWVMYFDGGISLHGTYWHDLFGYRRSHGCVNLTISDAHWLYKWFSGATPNAKGEIENAVYVYSSGTYGSGVLRDK